MVVIAKTSNKLIRIREFHIDYVGHAQPSREEYSPFPFASDVYSLKNSFTCSRNTFAC
jgi:hypothetical protein